MCGWGSSLSIEFLLSCTRYDIPDRGGEDGSILDDLGKLELWEAEIIKRVNGGGENAVLPEADGGVLPLALLLGGDTYLADKDVGKVSVCIVCLRGDEVLGDRPIVYRRKGGDFLSHHHHLTCYTHTQPSWGKDDIYIYFRKHTFHTLVSSAQFCLLLCH